MSMHARIVMDIDDVISFHKNRDYANAIPNYPVIQKMRALAEQGVEFVLFTARGQISCNGDIKKIEEEKGPVLRAWLEKHNVPYSELRFGKPIGDVYVDDGAMTPDEFVNSDFLAFKGGSKEYVERLGKYVIKECSSVNATEVRDWYAKAKYWGYKVPDVYACTYNKIRMQYIPGVAGNEYGYRFDNNIVTKIASIAISFASVPGDYTFDAAKYIKYLETNALDRYSAYFVLGAEKAFSKISDKIVPSFSHGDLTTMNTIVADDGIYMIDPVPRSFSSYMMDLAKLRMSVNGYNEMFYNVNRAADSRLYRMHLDEMLKRLGLYDIVLILEFTCWVRLIKYRKSNEHQYRDLTDRLEQLMREVLKNE